MSGLLVNESYHDCSLENIWFDGWGSYNFQNISSPNCIKSGVGMTPRNYII